MLLQQLVLCKLKQTRLYKHAYKLTSSTLIVELCCNELSTVLPSCRNRRNQPGKSVTFATTASDKNSCLVNLAVPASFHSSQGLLFQKNLKAQTQFATMYTEEPIIIYFPLRGRAELIKLAIVAGGGSFKFEEVDRTKLKSDFDTFPFGQVPV